MYSQPPGVTRVGPVHSPSTLAIASAGSRSQKDYLGRRAGGSSLSPPAVDSMPRDRVVTVEPAVLPLSPRCLAWLCESDRYLASKLLSEPFVYVDHPLFRKHDAEEALFGGVAKFAGNASYFTETEHTAPAELGGALLDADSERLLFQRFNYARMRVADLLKNYEGRRMPRVALQRMLAWFHRALMIRGRLTQSNIRLVMSTARRPQFRGLDFNEVISAGNFALLRSIDRFDCSRGFKFSTYACQGIFQRILHVVDSTRRYRRRFVSEFEEALERGDSAVRRHENQAAEWVEELREILRTNRAGLTGLEHTVIQHRFGLAVDSTSGKPMTLKEVGALLGVTKERIRQIQNRALTKLKSAFAQEYLAA